MRVSFPLLNISEKKEKTLEFFHIWKLIVNIGPVMDAVRLPRGHGSRSNDEVVSQEKAATIKNQK
jgi:hypothetical protein